MKFHKSNKIKKLIPEKKKKILQAIGRVESPTLSYSFFFNFSNQLYLYRSSTYVNKTSLISSLSKWSHELGHR